MQLQKYKRYFITKHQVNQENFTLLVEYAAYIYYNSRTIAIGRGSKFSTLVYMLICI